MWYALGAVGIWEAIRSGYPVAQTELPKLPSAVIAVRGTHASPPAVVPASLPADVVSDAAKWMSRILGASPVELHLGKLWDFLTADDVTQFGGLPPGAAREHRGALLLMQVVCESRVVLCGPYGYTNKGQGQRRDARAVDATAAGAAVGADNGDAAMASADETGDEGGATEGATLSGDKRPPAAPSMHKSPTVKRRRHRAAAAAASQKLDELLDDAEEAGTAGGGVSDGDAAMGAVPAVAAAAEPPAGEVVCTVPPPLSGPPPPNVERSFNKGWCEPAPFAVRQFKGEGSTQPQQQCSSDNVSL